MKYITKEVRIGIAGIVALCILVFGINFLKGINLFKPSSYFYIQFSNVSGLAKSSPVYADGVRIGIVHDIHYNFNEPNDVFVEIEVDTELRIPKGSTAELSTDFMGGARLDLLLATNPREKIMVGDTIPGNINGGIMENAAMLMPEISKMIPKLDSILSSLNSILSNQSIPTTLNYMEKTTANLEVASKQLRVIMSNDIPQLTGKLNVIGDNFVVVSEKLKQVDYETMFTEIDQTLASVKEMTDKMNSKNSTVGLLLNDPQLYNNLNETAANAASLLENIKEYPKRYVHFSLFGRKDKQ